MTLRTLLLALPLIASACATELGGEVADDGDDGLRDELPVKTVSMAPDGYSDVFIAQCDETFSCDVEFAWVVDEAGLARAFAATNAAEIAAAPAGKVWEVPLATAEIMVAAGHFEADEVAQVPVKGLLVRDATAALGVRPGTALDQGGRPTEVHEWSDEDEDARYSIELHAAKTLPYGLTKVDAKVWIAWD